MVLCLCVIGEHFFENNIWRLRVHIDQSDFSNVIISIRKYAVKED